MRARKLPNMSKKTTVTFILIVGLFLGTVFTFGTKYWNAPIEKSDATYVEATLDEIKVRRQKGAVVRFTDYEVLDISASCLTNKLEENLEKLSGGDRLILWVHPNSNTILEMRWGGKVLMNFDDSMEKLQGNNFTFGVLGLIMYGCAAISAVSLTVEYIKRKKHT